LTFSVVARDKATGQYGVAVASKALCVGAHVPWGAPGVGAVATQAWHNLRYGWQGLELLLEGCSAAAVVHRLSSGDEEAPHRQLGVVDRDGRCASYTGSLCLPWAGGMSGDGYAVQGNLLAGPQVVEAMAAKYEQGVRLPFPQRLLEALLAGDEAGGDRRGRQSAALRIWPAPGDELGSSVLVDIRIDDAPMPVHALTRMLPKLWTDWGVEEPMRGLRRQASPAESLSV
jgi:uncharacterized Ntn-hydrolase superfamily protein